MIKNHKLNFFHRKNGAGFTLIELLVVIAVIGLLASVVMVSLNTARAKARDARRLGDMHQLQRALGLYYDANGQYPAAVSDSGCAGWDTTADGNFLRSLVTAGFLARDASDPSLNASCGNYMYYRYNSGDYGCDPARGAYYVLVIINMETSNPYPSSPGWSCSQRNWQDGIGWVAGTFEK